MFDVFDHGYVASPAKQSNKWNESNSKSACNFLEPIKTDLIENLFTNECGDAVGFFCLLIANIYLKIVQAHGALRLAFHDAIGISPKLG